MKFILLACSGILTFAACNDSVVKKETKTASATESRTADLDTVSKMMVADSVPKNIQVDSVIHLSFPTDSSAVMVKGYLDKKGDPVICYLQVVKGKRLTATLTPEKAKANIRFSHIGMPDGKTDGPFGSVMKYDLVQRGMYKLYIAPNRMAGDPVSTDFLLMVKVQ